MRGIALLLLSSCATDHYPVAAIVYDGFSADEESRVWAGAAAWRELGYGLAPLDGDPDMTVTVENADLRGDYGGLASAELGLILLDASRLSPWGLQATAAHEFGHVLLPTGEHTDRGVMASPPTASTLSDEDRALACAEAGRGC